MYRLTTLVLACFIVIATAGSEAYAQYAPAPPPPDYGAPVAPPVGMVRSGFLIGFSLGGGSFNCSDCSDEDALSGFAFDLHLGGMINPRMGLMFDGWGVSHSLEGGSIIHVIDTVALQVWVAPRIWIKGGLGIGQLSVDNDDGDTVARSERGLSLMAAGGVEIYQGTIFALDLQARLGVASYEDVSVAQAAFSLGFNWY